MGSAIVLGVLLIGCVWAGPARGQGKEAARQIELRVGDQREFRVQGMDRVSLAATGAIDLRVTGPDRFILHGVSEGRATLLIFRRGKPSVTWEVRVLPDLAARAREECLQALGAEGCAGLAFASAQGELVLTGEVRDLEAYHHYRRVRSLFPRARSLVQVDPSVLDGLVSAINLQLADAGIRGARLGRVGRRLLLEGTVEDEAERHRVEVIVRAVMDAALSPAGEVGPP
jgi:Flp pilus assembly secretin CpaC